MVFDEIQKLNGWSDLVKTAWDRQKMAKNRLHLVLLGSSSLQLTQGLSESLAGRFEVIPVNHWSYLESKLAFKIGFDEFLKYGGYPGSYSLLGDEGRFRKYMMESVFESVVNKDILRYASVKKPALFRQTFSLACQFPAQEISYNKLLGQLQEAGNVDQLKHYLDLFSQAFLIRLLFKFTKSSMSRTSSPKILPCAPVFTSLFLKRELLQEEKGRVFESMVGTRLCENFESVYFWRDGVHEVDFVVDTGSELIGVEVKIKKRKAPGVAAFKIANRGAKTVFVDFDNYAQFEKDPAGFLKEYAV